MNYYILYVIAGIPIVCSIVAWFVFSKINWWEALSASVVGIVFSVCVYWGCFASVTADRETWSGNVIVATYSPPWTEYYEEAIYRTEYYSVQVSSTDSKGRTTSRTEMRSRRVFDHWEPRTRRHSAEYAENDTITQSVSIDSGRYDDIKNKFGGRTKAYHVNRRTMEHNSRQIAGDDKDYDTINDRGYVYPVNDVHHFTNKVKACKTVFSFIEVPKDVKVYPYPTNSDYFLSDRTMGQTGVSRLELDQWNARYGATKKINLVVCQFNGGAEMAQYQESAWIGGKKNDFVVCFGGTPTKPTWVKVFGWTESALAKHNTETIVLENGMNSGTLAKIGEEIVANYHIKDFHKFDYLTIDVPFSYVILDFFLVLVVYIGLMVWFFLNSSEQSRETLFAMIVKRYTKQN